MNEKKYSAANSKGSEMTGVIKIVSFYFKQIIKMELKILCDF